MESISFRRGRCPQDLLRRRLLDSDLAFHVYHEALPSAGADGAYSPNPTTSSDNYFPLHSGNGPRVLPLRSSQAAGRNELSCLSQAPIWFQLAKIRVTIYRAFRINNLPRISAALADWNRTMEDRVAV